jgi:hypothetical protein
MAKKTAVVIIHGIGEQVPMETLNGFVDAVWTRDLSLTRKDKPDPNTGEKRSKNASWSKPDARNRSFELQLITTESDENGRRVDFFEYYWAHRVTGTTWEQVRAWLFGLMLRNPFTKVPKGVLPAWCVLWLVFFLFLYASLIAGMAVSKDVIHPEAVSFEPAHGTLVLATWVQAWPKWLIAVVWGAVGLALGWALTIMVDVAGDVVRYVQATPKNIAIRQSIRENGVQLLETLMGIDENGQPGRTEYDRIIVVGHSLGTIVAYDILTHAFGRHNTRLDPAKVKGIKQDNRVALEELLRDAYADPDKDFPIEAYGALQDACRNELGAIGNPWIVSDFISLGSPLTHAEFLLAADRAALEVNKEKRILPTCPPTLEFDQKTDLLHFTYRTRGVDDEGDSHDPAAPRMPHHAALFAYTRWTNIYSPLRGVLVGDIVSGPVGHQFGLTRKTGTPLSGIRDIAVLPCAPDEAKFASQDRKRRMLTHLRYWDCDYSRDQAGNEEPFHIRALREALDLGRKHRPKPAALNAPPTQ